jgi:hypothetical protein
MAGMHESYKISGKYEMRKFQKSAWTTLTGDLSKKNNINRESLQEDI